MCSILKSSCRFVPALLGFGDENLRAMLSYMKKGAFGARFQTKGMSMNFQERTVTMQSRIEILITKREMCCLSMMLGPVGGNSRGYHATISPGTNCIMNARAGARVLGCLANGGLDQVQLVKPATLEAALKTTPPIVDVGIGLKTEFNNGGWCCNLDGVVMVALVLSLILC